MKIFSIIIALFVSFLFLGCTNNVGKFTKTWINEDQINGEITKVIIRTEADLLFVHMWARCQPVDCDWGEEITDIADSNNKQLSIKWNLGFAVITQEIYYLFDGRLMIKSHKHFTDNSGRTDSDFKDYFSVVAN